MDPQFGCVIERVEPSPALDWQTLESKVLLHVDSYLSGVIPHKNFRVSVCDVPVLEPTGLKVFDKAYDGKGGTFMTGNVSSDIQQSWFVRPVSQTECNGKQYEPGYLRDHDLIGLREKVGYIDGARQVLSWFKAVGGSRNIPEDQSTILYAVFHRTPEKSYKVVDKLFHGWIHTDSYGNLLNKVVLDKSPKSHLVMEKAIQFFTHERSNEENILVVENGEVIFLHNDFQEKAIQPERQR